LQEQITSLIKNCHSISVDKRTQLQSWIRGFNVS
jgi:hypothetical protein